MKKTIFIFGALIVALLLLFQISKYSLLTGNFKLEGVIAAVAIVFFVVGVVLNKKSLHQKNGPKKEIDHKKIKVLGLTEREYEVLNGIASGLSNKEIGERLFLSESTIKTHVSNLMEKLNAKRRTQAVLIAKRLEII